MPFPDTEMALESGLRDPLDCCKGACKAPRPLELPGPAIGGTGLAITKGSIMRFGRHPYAGLVFFRGLPNLGKT